VRVLKTATTDLELRELGSGDAAAYYDLVQRNATHLTRLGNYREEVAATEQEQEADLAEPTEAPYRFGVYFENTLVGRVDLVPVAPPHYGLGYWLAEKATGQGLATRAVQALLSYAGSDLNATEAFAGVTHGNTASVALLTRLGFSPIADFDTYTRFHLVLP
jgi:RimJ/RimL family protein N-acetyltransferase